MRFQYTINHVPEKTLYTVDALSRTPPQETSDAGNCTSTDEIEQFVQAVTAALPENQDRLDSYRKAPICSNLIEYCTSGWPARNKLSRDLKDYWRFRGELTLSSTLLLYQVVPASTRQMTLEKIHHGHQGIQRCRMHVSSSVWWPGVAREMENFVQSCPAC